MAFKPKAAITGSLRLAGGGVVFSGTADLSQFQVSDLIVATKDDSIYLRFSNEECNVMLGAKKHTIKDASSLVASEADSVFRLVSLNGELQDFEDTMRVLLGYWPVEVHGSLLGTKSGENLLYADLVQTDLCFYSEEASAVKEYLYATHCLNEPITNWTYNDELTDYKVTWDCNSGRLSISGEPVFTFIYADEFGVEENSTWTQTFADSPHRITDLRPEVFEEAISFARVAAFFRGLKTSYPSVWYTVLEQLSGVETDEGVTPRYIER
jgi:hypothetical protein